MKIYVHNKNIFAIPPQFIACFLSKSDELLRNLRMYQVNYRFVKFFFFFYIRKSLWICASIHVFAIKEKVSYAKVTKEGHNGVLTSRKTMVRVW